MGLLAASTSLCVVLVGFAVARKLRRDRREAAMLARRRRFAALARCGSLPALTAQLRRAVRSQPARIDLAVALQQAAPGLDRARRDVLRQAAVAARLDRALVRGLGSRDPVVRATAVLLLSRLRLDGVQRLLGPLVGDPDGDVRLVAVRALAELADAPAARVLIDALAAGLLPPERLVERLGAPWAVEPILQRLPEPGKPANHATPIAASPTGAVRRPLRAWLATALGLAADQRAEPALLALLRTGGAEERVSAARALATAGSAEAVPDLRAALADSEWPVRAQAARSLGRLGGADAVPALARLLSDRAWWVRANAAEALRQLGEPGLAALRAALDHHDRYARDRAREALALQQLAEAEVPS